MNFTGKKLIFLSKWLSQLTMAFIIVVGVSTGMLGCRKKHSSPRYEILPDSNPNPNYDSLKEVYDSIVSQYNASRILVDGLSTRNSYLDSEIKKRNAVIAELKNNMKDYEAKKIAHYENKTATLAEKLGKQEALNSTMKQLGSVLHVSNIRIYPLHISHSGKKLRLARKVKKLNMLRVFFDIDENFIADTGLKQFYIVITSPNGKLLKSTENTSGNLITFNGTSVDYSLLKEVKLSQNETVKNVVVNCKLQDITQKGAYRVSIYNGGYIIGNETVMLN